MPPNESKPNDLGSLLRLHRTRAGLSLRRIAVEARLAPSTILRLERGETTHVQARHLQAIAQVIGIDVEELYVAAGLLVTEELPELQPYLRIKYDLPDHAVDQIDAYFQALRNQWDQMRDQETHNDDSKEAT